VIPVFNGLSENRLEAILSGIRSVKIALIGDLCLDIYWLADMRRSELSRETPHFPLPVIEERTSPGAGGNVAANVAALEPGRFTALGAIGDDWRGKLLMDAFTSRGIDRTHVITDRDRFTCAYCKPLKQGYSGIPAEDPRIDFENFTPLPAEAEDQLIAALDEISPGIDALCVSDQFRFGCITPRVRERINQLAESGLFVVVDSRDRIGEYRHAFLKPNEIECANALGCELPAGLQRAAEITLLLAKRNHSCVAMTFGERGCVLCDGDTRAHVPTLPASPPIDTVGAGDCFLSAFTCALAAGASSPEAASFANLAASVVIRKIGTTGTASSEEIRARYRETAR